MGLFDKLKSIKNAVTGGAAKVYVDVSGENMKEPFSVTVRAQSTGGDVKYDRVYLKVEGIEQVEVPDVDVVYDEDGDSHRKREIVGARHTSFESDYTVASAGVIAENGQEEWTIEVELPSNALPVFRGRYTRHYYRVFAGLDCFGNDPDSGWVELNLQ
jgi:hypothetical protein